jgi:membrane-associated protease RseP (regulator of RpoE activity)
VPRQRPPAPGRYSARYLGVGLQPLTPGLREAFSVPDGIGVLIAEVYRDSPAARSGLAAGDTIVRMDRRTISSIPDVYRVLDYFEPGEEIEIEVIREGERQSLRVTLGERDVPAAREYGENWPSPRSGEPFFDPRWWEGIDEFLQRWRDYFEQERRGSPPAAL